MNPVRNAIVVGASSGIGRALACLLASEGYRVGLAARRLGLLQDVASAIGDTAVVKAIDVSKPEEAMQRLRDLIDAMTDVELFVISAGTGFENPTLDWESEHETIAVNVTGFAAMPPGSSGWPRLGKRHDRSSMPSGSGRRRSM